MHKKVTLSIETGVYDRFKRYCEKNAIMLSKRIENEMKKIMESEEGNAKRI